MKILLKYKKNNNTIVSESYSNSDYIINLINEDSKYIVDITPKENIEIIDFKLLFDYSYDKKDLIFVDGYQSWTDTKEFKVSESLHNVKKLPRKLIDLFSFDRYGDAYFKKYNKHVIHGFDLSYIKGKNERFIYSINNKSAYLIINHFVKNNKIILESDIKGLVLGKDKAFRAFEFYFLSSIDEGLKLLKQILNFNNDQKILGYTSWYNYYQNINESIIIDNLKSLDNRFNLFQIDDGYEEFVGDWLKIDKTKFPNGLSQIVKLIKEKSLIPGIWLSPFIAEEKSELFQKHKDYFLKDKNNQFVKCGSNWSGFYALDFYNLEAREFIKKCLLYYKSLGFKFFKLDFLYAVSLENSMGYSRARVTDECYSFLKDTLEGCTILGCGAIVSSSIQKFEYLRVGPDVSLKFDDIWYMKHMHRERISTKVTVQNTIYRSIYNGIAFNNDPDVFLLRDDNIELSFNQRKALGIINALFGNVLMTSDNISNYDQEKKELLDFMLLIHKEAKDISYKRNNKIIEITYSLDNKEYKLNYNILKGVMNNG